MVTVSEIEHVARQRLGHVEAIVFEHTPGYRNRPAEDGWEKGLWHCLSTRPVIGSPMSLVLRRRSLDELLAAVEKIPATNLNATEAANLA